MAESHLPFLRLTSLEMNSSITIAGRPVSPVGFGMMSKSLSHQGPSTSTTTWTGLPLKPHLPLEEHRSTIGGQGIHTVTYGPVGRGFLTGQIRKREDMDKNDWRLHYARFQPVVFEQNLELAEAVERIAKRMGVSPASLTIARTRREGRKTVPRPGASKVEDVVRNCADVDLSREDLAEMQKTPDTLPVDGPRYGG